MSWASPRVVVLDIGVSLSSSGIPRQSGVATPGWPLQPTVTDPERFRDVAAALVKLFSEAHVTLARIRARRYLS